MAAESTKFKSSAAALQAGLTAYKRGDYAGAVPALEFAAADNQFMAQYALAQLYSDNASAETDHAKAYMLFQSIADEFSDADPDDDKRAPYIAKSLTALAGYLRVGIPEIGLKADAVRAADYLHHAALFFGDEDAQFELVKMKLKGEGVPEDIASAKHWLAVLTQRGHAGAQAFLADLYWRGKFMAQDKIRAFALITVAVEHAPPRERIWIEDVYQNIFCGAGEGIRKQATGMVAEWRTRYGRKAEDSRPVGLDPLYPLAVRTCQNGDKVMPLNVKNLDANAQQPGKPYTPAGGLPDSAPVTTSGLRDAASKTTEGLPTPGLASGLMSNPSDAR
ncbi:MAG: sel1 repeat family protein [Hyphomicrobiaceae bacterium]